MAYFPCLEGLAVAANSRSLFDRMMIYFERETSIDFDFTADLQNLWVQFIDHTNDMKLFISELDGLPPSCLLNTESCESVPPEDYGHVRKNLKKDGVVLICVCKTGIEWLCDPRRELQLGIGGVKQTRAYYVISNCAVVLGQLRALFSSRRETEKRKKKPSREEDDLSQPWVCEEIDAFTPIIRYFDFPKIRMPSHIKTYDGSENPEDHLKIFQAAAKTERWVMPTWCHMFNSTLTGNARVWFDDLPTESIDNYDDLKKAFLENYLQQKKYIKDPIEFHNIKQRDEESMEDFVRRYKLESIDVKGVPEFMRISGFVHGITNPELIKRLHDKIPKTVDEMMSVTTSFFRGEVAALNHEQKKSFPPWKQQEGTQRKNFKKGGFQNQQRSDRKQDRFTLLTKIPKEIFALEKWKFKAPPPMTTTVENRNHTKFCEFHGEVGHNTDGRDPQAPKTMVEERVRVAINPEYLEQTIMIGSTLTEEDRNKQKKRGQAAERNQAILEEVGKLVEAGIMKEVHYHNWLSNPVMIGKNLEVYVDDLVIKSRTEDEIVHDIEETFKTLRGINMKLNPKNCTFRVEEGMFLGYKVNTKGLKVCPDKVDAVLNLPSLKCLKDMQKLHGKLASLNRFLAKSAEKSLPFFKTLKKCTKKSDFHWTTEMEEAFKQMKQLIAELPMLTAPMEKEELIVYLATTKETVSAVLMTEREAKQMPIYFVSRALRGPELNYTSMEKPKVSVKGQILADFIVERLEEESPDTLMEAKEELPKPFDTTNNEAEYEALIAGLRIMEQMGVKNLQENVDSRLVANKVNKTYVAKETDMIRYLEKVRTLTSSFKAFSIRQIPRSENKKADALSKIASTSFAHLSKQVLVEELKEKSISEVKILAVVEEEGDTWMTPIFEYLKDETLPADVKKSRVVIHKSQRFVVINGILYRKSFLGPWLRCVGPLQANYVLREIHEGSYARALIRACQDCQVHKPVLRNPQQKLTPITSPLPFYKWGIDLARPFSEGPGNVKFLIVAMDYFIKWIDAKPVATITDNQIKKFVWENIVCRFGLSGEIISDNEK
ncbi:reverse transcriptase domain-containing protein [Tanacetum coccineum]